MDHETATAFVTLLAVGIIYRIAVWVYEWVSSGFSKER
jgi:hypothetical protein